jgi:hypothetical protein
VSSKLSDLAQAHLAIVALLDSNIISLTTRRQLEVFRDSLEGDIAELRGKEAKERAELSRSEQANEAAGD